MVRSMTGYGKAVGVFGEKRVTVEIKSLNSKSLDLTMRVAGMYKEREMELRSRVAGLVERGKVEFVLQVEYLGGAAAQRLNGDVIGGYYDQIRSMAAERGIVEPVDWWSVLVRMPDVFKSERDVLRDEEWGVVCGVVDEALARFEEFRVQEGEALEVMFGEKIRNISALLAEVEPYEKGRVERIKGELRERLSQLGVDYDRNRLEQELIFYIEKLDVNEEKTRLRNHLRYFEETMGSGISNGKKLGFIAQEMGREINTLGSKSNQSEMQIIVVKMKDELEQIKEQVLNVL